MKTVLVANFLNKINIGWILWFTEISEVQCVRVLPLLVNLALISMCADNGPRKYTLSNPRLCYVERQKGRKFVNGIKAANQHTDRVR